MGYICKHLLIGKYLYKSNICICNVVIDHQMFLQNHGYLSFLQIFEQKEEGKYANPIHVLFLPPQKMPMTKCKELQEITFAFNFDKLYHITNIVHVIGQHNICLWANYLNPMSQVHLLFKTNARCFIANHIIISHPFGMNLLMVTF